MAAVMAVDGRRCGRCAAVKPLASFHRSRRGGGRKYWCKACANRYRRQWYAGRRSPRATRCRTCGIVMGPHSGPGARVMQPSAEDATRCRVCMREWLAGWRPRRPALCDCEMVGGVCERRQNRPLGAAA
jgi:hypothetical protein